tara:strand:- start:264 stop:827 length:564 start_codon:yes stop_codon:yes gene_type:complete
MASILKVDKIRGTGLDSDTITLDGSGNITIPKNVTFSGTTTGASFAGTGAFSARSNNPTTWATLSTDEILSFNNVSTGESFDTDSNYNTSTYKYTAPATGVYLFWYTIYTAESDTGNEFSFLKNSSRIDYFHGSDDKFTSHNSTNNDHQQTVSIVVPMTANDTMAVISVTGSDWYPPHCSWGGCRLK